MFFVNDPRRAQIEPMHELMQIWADYWRDRPRYNVSITYVAMCAIRDWSKRISDIREGIVLGKPIRVTHTDAAVIAEKMRKLIHNDDAWSGHKRDRDVLVIYYLKVHPTEPRGRIAKKLDCRPWQVEKIVSDALYYLSKMWRD